MSELTRTVHNDIHQRRYGHAIDDLSEALTEATNESNADRLSEVLELARQVASAAETGYSSLWPGGTNYKNRARAEEIVRLAEEGLGQLAKEGIVPVPERAHAASAASLPTDVGQLAGPSRREGRPMDIEHQPAALGLVAQWVSVCVVLFGIAAGLSALGGVIVFVDQVGPDQVAAITGLIVGAVAAALWVGLAVALVLLREIAAGIRTLMKQLKAE